MINDTVNDTVKWGKGVKLSELEFNSYCMLKILNQSIQHKFENIWCDPLTESISDRINLGLECSLLGDGFIPSQIQVLRPLIDISIHQQLSLLFSWEIYDNLAHPINSILWYQDDLESSENNI
jgi:hypothetical protein